MGSENNFELLERLQDSPSFSEILDFTAEKNPIQPFLVANQETWTARSASTAFVPAPMTMLAC